MPILLTYILKVALFQVLLVAFYLLVLRRDTFFKINRAYLLSSILFSLIAPLIEVHIPGWLQWKIQQAPVQTTILITTVITEETVRPALNLNDYVMIIILAGIVFMLIRSIVQLFSLRKVRITDTKQKDGYKIAYLSEEVQPFSFGKTIYINPDKHSQEEIAEIIEHELVHIRQRHSIDIMISLANKCLFWWNPAAWILHNAIRTNLEYIADGQMIQKGFERKSYQYHLLQISLSSSKNNPAVNNFSFFSNLKNRIYMMNKQQTKPFFKMKWLLAILVCSIAILACNNKNMDGVADNANKTNSSTSIQIDSIPQSTNLSLSDNVAIYVNEKKVTKEEFNKLGANQIESISVNKRPGDTSISVTLKKNVDVKKFSEPKNNTANVSKKDKVTETAWERMNDLQSPRKIVVIKKTGDVKQDIKTHTIGKATEYYINNKMVTQEDIANLPAEQISSITVLKNDTTVSGKIYIETK